MDVPVESAGISLEDAIKDKYCWQEDEASRPQEAANVNESALGYRPGKQAWLPCWGSYR